jgi:hypothetical protein
MQNVIRLVVFEIVALVVTQHVVEALFGINIFDFSSPTGRYIGIGLTMLFLFFIYTSIDDGEITKIGAMAVYEENSAQRVQAETTSNQQLTALAVLPPTTAAPNRPPQQQAPPAARNVANAKARIPPSPV